MKLKKFLIIIICMLSFIIFFCLGEYLKEKYNLKTAESIDFKTLDEIKIQRSEDINDNVILGYEIIESTIEKNDLPENMKSSNVEEIKEYFSTEAAIQEKINSSKNFSQTFNKEETKTTIQIEPTKIEPTPVETPQVEQSQTQQETENVITTKQEEYKTTAEKKEIIPENTSTQEEIKMETKYIRNDNMINKIKSVINNNLSEFMKAYGYEIVVDSSIKTQTNQFTFTEDRVKSYLPYKFGTIRIYAEDYYVNGEILMTECYIL